MVISGTCTTEYETGSDDGLGVEGAVEVEDSTGVGVILLFFCYWTFGGHSDLLWFVISHTNYGYRYWWWYWGHPSESFHCSYEGWCW